jgi:hypothetical protein
MIDKPMLSVAIGEEGAMSGSINRLVEMAHRVKDRMGSLDPRVWFERISALKAKEPELVVVRPGFVRRVDDKGLAIPLQKLRALVYP